jgi:hypothetical protein
MTFAATPSIGRIAAAAEVVERGDAQCLGLAGPTRSCRRGIALQRGAVTMQCEPHYPAALLENAGHDKPVAAIVSRPAQHRDGARRPATRNCIGDRTPGILHQQRAGYPAGDRQAVGIAHLLRRQQGVAHPTLR